MTSILLDIFYDSHNLCKVRRDKLRHRLNAPYKNYFLLNNSPTLGESREECTRPTEPVKLLDVGRGPWTCRFIGEPRFTTWTDRQIATWTEPVLNGQSHCSTRPIHIRRAAHVSSCLPGAKASAESHAETCDAPISPKRPNAHKWCVCDRPFGAHLSYV